jgi:hypothetical protein
MTPFALELLINLVLVSLIFIFQIPKRILCLILNKISIYLPFNNSDLETIKKLKHEKNKESGIVRSCNLNEYISILKDDDNVFSSKSYSRIDMFLYFYCCIIIILLTKPFFLKDDLTNMINGFGIFFIFYSLYVSLCYINQEKNKIKFTIGIIISFIIYMMITIYYKEFWSIDEKEVIENIKETLNEFHRKEIFKDSNVTNNNSPFYFKHVNPLNLNFFFGIIFSIFLSILYIMTEDTYYFDVILINASKGTHNSQLKLIENLTKGKIILNFFLLFALIQPLFKGYFPNLELKIYLIIILFTTFLELMFNTQSIWYDTFKIEQNNYELSLQFCKTNESEIKKKLPSLKRSIMAINKTLIDYLYKLIFLSFTPSLLTVLYLYNTLYGKNKINKSFIQCFVYIILMSFSIGKGILLNGRIIYYGLIKRK